VAHDLHEVLALTRELLVERDPDALLRRISEIAARATGAERALIFVHDFERRDLALIPPAGGADPGREVRVPEEKGLEGHVFRTGDALNLEDARKDPRRLAAVDEALGAETRSLLAVPLRGQGGERLGVLEAANKAGLARFTDEDLEILSVLAAQAAIALENARSWRLAIERAASAEIARGALVDELAGEFVGGSDAIRHVRRTAQQVAQAPVTVLVTGESGTGKSHIARLIHYKSPRAGKPFVYLNCAAIPEGLVEAELFGIERGVATGVEAKAGRIEQAHEGTLFLDEIADMSLEVQAKVLQVIQDRELVHVGGRRTIRVDVRIIAATNRDLSEEIAKGRFREDLYYRLAVVNLWIPPLRERKEDLVPLLDHLFKKVCQEYNRRMPRVTRAAIEALVAYDWPGNVREVDNEVRRIISLAPPGGEIDVRVLSDRVRTSAVRERVGALVGRGTIAEAVRALEEEMIRAALHAESGNKVRTARSLGLSREGLRKKMSRYGIE